MRIYVSKKNIHDIEVPSTGHLSLHPGRYPQTNYWNTESCRSAKDLDKDPDYYPLDVDDEIFNKVASLTTLKDNNARFYFEEMKKQTKAAEEASFPLLQKISREREKPEFTQGKYAFTADIAQNGNLTYRDYAREAIRFLYDVDGNGAFRDKLDEAIKKAGIEKEQLRIEAHIGYILSNGKQKEESAKVLKQFIQDFGSSPEISKLSEVLGL